MDERIAALEAKFEAHKEYTEDAFSEVKENFVLVNGKLDEIAKKLSFGEGFLSKLGLFSTVLIAILGGAYVFLTDLWQK